MASQDQQASISIIFYELRNCRWKKLKAPRYSENTKMDIEEIKLILFENKKSLSLSSETTHQAQLVICLLTDNSMAIVEEKDNFKISLRNLIKQDKLNKRYSRKTNELRKVSSGINQELKDYNPLPILLITNDSLKKEGGYNNYRIKFFDGSIWHRHVSYINDSLSNDSNFQDKLLEVLDSFKFAFEKNLYYTFSAQEYLEYQCRNVLNSFLLKIEGGHSKAVYPTSFFSETECRIKADIKLKNLVELEWGGLLIDDHSHISLRRSDEFLPSGSEKSILTPNKCELIDQILNRDIEKHRNGKKNFIRILNFKNEKKFLNKYKDILKYGLSCIERYPAADFILLDYYLGNKGMQSFKGISIIKYLLDPNSGLSNKKPFDKHWIFPISVFDFAFRNAFLEQAIEQSNNDGTNHPIEISDLNNKIHFGHGADPINTPELFRYMVYTMLEEQKKMLEFDFEDIREILNIPLNDKKKGDTTVDQDIKKKNAIRLSRKQYPLLARKLINYSLYKEEDKFKKVGSGLSTQKGSSELIQESKSLFIKSFNDEGNELLISFCIHLQHLLYLVAFESESEWLKMWEEYLLLNKLARQLKNEGIFKGDIEDFEKSVRHIYDYILSLKKEFSE